MTNNNIYADNAATTKIDKESIEAMMPWITEEYGNASQRYSLGRRAKKAIEEARKAIADCINASPEEIFFTSGGTESNNWAIKGIIEANHRPCTIVTTAIEHHSILNTCRASESCGTNILYVSPDRNGIITSDTLIEALKHQSTLVSIMYVNNEVGCIEPIKELADVVHDRGALFHTDAVQAMGHIPVDVREIDVDLLSSSAHKFNGPKGIGFLFIRKGISISPINHGGAQENQLRAGTENVAQIVAMAAALENNCKNIVQNHDHIMKIEACFLSRLKENGVSFIRNGVNHAPGIISISLKGMDGEAILHRLDLQNICISTGAACNSGKTEKSHVLKAMGIDDDYLEGTIRISFGKYNTEEEAVVVADALKKITDQRID